MDDSDRRTDDSSNACLDLAGLDRTLRMSIKLMRASRRAIERARQREAGKSV